jgi:hypothetical protein
VTTTDPESRIMTLPGGGFGPAYNLQISTDAYEKAIVALSLSESPNDRSLLKSAFQTIKFRFLASATISLKTGRLVLEPLKPVSMYSLKSV